MNTAIDHAHRRSPRGRQHVGLLGVVVAGLLLGGCGTSTPTGNSGSTPPSAAGAEEPAAVPDAVAYSQCMRDHGVPGFPDPDANGELAVSTGELGVDPESDQYNNADEACAHLMPQRSAEEQQKDYEAALAYAQCMRDEGVEFPDPPAPGAGPDTQSNGSGDAQGGSLDPSSPQFQAAHAACADLLPEGDAGPSLSESGAE